MITTYKPVENNKFTELGIFYPSKPNNPSLIGILLLERLVGKINEDNTLICKLCKRVAKNL